MTSEISVSATVTIVNGGLQWRNARTSFKADQTYAEGPTPGMLSVTTAGEDVDLSELTEYGLMFIENIDSDPGDGSKDVDYGIWDGASFYPLGTVKPGEGYPVRLSPRLGNEYTTGTGTSGASINTLRVKAVGATTKIAISAFGN